MTCPECDDRGTVPDLDCGQPWQSLRCDIPCPNRCPASRTADTRCTCGKREDAA